MWAYLSTLFDHWFRVLVGRRQTLLLMVGLDGACGCGQGRRRVSGRDCHRFVR